MAGRIARSRTAADGFLARTSFHGLLDVIEACAQPGSVLLIDDRVYPVMQWAAAAAGTVRAARKGCVISYRHLDPADAARRACQAGAPVVILTDGVCGSCLRPAPLAELTELAARTSGFVIVDDSLAAGILGRRVPGAGPFGIGGAGTSAWLGLPADRHIWVASLAKAFGVPVAAVTGPAAVIDHARRHGSARTHASPPTPADVATLAALPSPAVLNHRRRRLGRMSEITRKHGRHLGLAPLGIALPIIHFPEGSRPTRSVQRSLEVLGVRVLATVGRCTGRRALTVCLRADTTQQELLMLLDSLSREALRSTG
jgi:8-amino-7-oxononanoate synthase